MTKNRFTALLLAFAMIISLLPFSVLTSASDLPDGLIGYYSFDGDLKNAVGGNSATEVGSLTGSATGTAIGFAEGQHGKGVNISGSGSNGLLLDASFSGSTSTYSVSFWMKAASLSNYTTTVFLGTDSDNWVSFTPQLSGVSSLWSHDSSGYHNDVTGPAMPADTWYHVSFIRDGSTTKLYINGEYVSGATSVADVVNASTGLYLGVNFWDTPFDGIIDELYIYDKAITEDELTAIYSGETSVSIKQTQLQETVAGAKSEISSLFDNYSESSIQLYSSILDNIESRISVASTLDEIYSLYDELEEASSVLNNKIYEYGGKTSLNSDLLAYYPLTSSAKDYSGNSNDGEVKGSGASFNDGYLSLPGGSAGSSAGYVELPTGMFDNQDTLTISVWLKNKTGSGNYSALFFGTTESYPTQYWLLNPKNPNGYYKSVITNSMNSGSPWNTEYGISPTVSSQGIQGPTTDSDWGLYTTVIESGSITAYYNGELIGTVATSRTVSEFGADLVAYIGKSSYSDIFYQGGVQDLRVYDKVITEVEAAALYDEVMVSKAVAELEAGDLSAIRENFTLPNSISNLPNVTITWSSNNSAISITDGNQAIVTRDQDADVSGTLEAEISCGSYSVSTEFDSTVLAGDDQKDVEAAANEYTHDATAVWEDINLPVSGNYGATITWDISENDYATLSGNTLQINKRPDVDEGNASVTLTATFDINGKTTTRDFTVEIIEEFYGYILGYTNTNSTDNDRTGGLHLAYSEDGATWTALNSDSGILFATIDTNDGTKNLSTGISFKNPYLYRKPDGTFGYSATQKKDTNSIFVYNSENLYEYEELDMLAVSDGSTYPKYVNISYDYENQVYVINWSADRTTYYDTTTRDFSNIISTTLSTDKSSASVDAKGLTEDADTGNMIAVTKAEYEKFVLKLGEVYNTGVKEFNNIEVEQGTIETDVALPDTATLLYNDGGTYNLPVEWDTSSVNWDVAGEYEITGKIQQTQYNNPFIEQRADPNIYYDEDTGYYYFTASYPAFYNVNNGYDRITLRQATSIEGLALAKEVTIWESPLSGLYSAHIWAPEIHKINGEFYIFFAGGRADSIWAIRPYVLKANKGASGAVLADPSSWDQTPVACTSDDSAYFQNMSLDMTYFEHNGKHYVCWADIIGQSALYLQEIDPDQPWLGVGEVVMLTTPEYGWERDTERVNEGATILKTNGKIYMTFSASGTGSEYCIGMLYIDEDADLMNPDNWTKVSYSVLTSNDVPGEYGPGHNSFTVDEYGNAIFVYHARSEECYLGLCEWSSANSLYDPCRHARLKRVHYSGVDGAPILNMTYEEELNSEYSTVSLKIIVTAESEEVDKSALQNAITEYANAYSNSNDYTTDSYKSFEQAYTLAKSVYDAPDATQEQVNSAVDALNSAYNQLKLIGSSNTSSNEDSSTDSSVDSSTDSSVDSSTDSSVDSSTDSGVDSSTSTSADSSTESGMDSSTDSSEGSYVSDDLSTTSNTNSQSSAMWNSSTNSSNTGDSAIYGIYILFAVSVLTFIVIHKRKRNT